MTDFPENNTLLDKYRIIKEIGRGGMARIFEAEHTRSQERCALKILAPSDEAYRMSERFLQEFKALSRLKHPNVLTVFECGTFQSRPYFSMELLHGVTLKDSISDWMRLSSTERFARARHVLLQVTAALDHIHQHGWVHRDVTPANIMLLEDGSVKLMDFGVVKIPGNEQTVAGEVIGTVAYMAPEQIKNQALDSRTDLYSLGASLYLMLTGKRPFSARTLAGYVQKHLTTEPTPPSTHVAMIPSDLETACLRLLQKSPDDRFASANHLLQYISLSTRIIRNRKLFGRAQEMHQLQECIATLSRGQGGLVLLEGKHGMGRTRLLSGAEKLLQDFSIPYNFCNSHSPQQPMYDTFQGLFNEFSNSDRTSVLVRENINRDDSWEIYSLLRNHLEGQNQRCLLIDNLELADEGSLRLLEFLLLSSLDDQLPILFIVTVNTDSEHTFIRDILEKRVDLVEPKRIPVVPLKSAAVEEWLLCSALNESNIAIMAHRLHTESEGAPYILDEMIKTLQKLDILPSNIRKKMRIEADAIATIPLPLPGFIQDVILTRIQNLPPFERAIIELLTVSEQGLPFRLLLDIIHEFVKGMEDLHPKILEQTLEQLVLLDMIELREQDGERIVEIAHLWYREIFLPNLKEYRRKQYHHCLGVSLERYHIHNIPRVVETLSYHFEHAQSYGKAYAYLWQSANKLRQRSLFEKAREYLDRAIAVEPKARAHLALYEANEKLANIYLSHSYLSHQLNDTENATEKAHLADQIACEQHNTPLIARVATEKARQARDLYDLQEADLQIKRALRYADESGQPALSILPLYESGALLWEAGQPEKARTLFEKSLQLSEQLHDSFGIAKVNNGLGVLSMSLGDSAQARKSFEAAIAHSTKNHRIEDLVIARTNLSELFHCIGYFSKAVQLLNSTIKESLDFQFHFGVSIALRHSAILHIDLGRYSEAKEQAQSALDFNRKQHNQQEYLAALVAWLRCHFSAGNWEDVGPRLQEAIDLLPQYDSEGYSPIVLSWKARMEMHLHKDIDGAITLLKLAKQRIKPNRKFQEVRCMLNIARGWSAVGKTQEAVSFANEALVMANKSGYRYYAMRSRHLLSTLVEDEKQRLRHLSIADSLVRSLASSLSKMDAESFLARNMVTY